MDEPPRAEQPPPGIILDEPRSERDINVAQEKWPLQGQSLGELARRLGEALALCERGWTGVPPGRYPAALYTLLQLILTGRAPPLMVGGVVVFVLLILWLIVLALR